jgi:hypothetical protein
LSGRLHGRRCVVIVIVVAAAPIAADHGQTRKKRNQRAGLPLHSSLQDFAASTSRSTQDQFPAAQKVACLRMSHVTVTNSFDVTVIRPLITSSGSILRRKVPS